MKRAFSYVYAVAFILSAFVVIRYSVRIQGFGFFEIGYLTAAITLLGALVMVSAFLSVRIRVISVLMFSLAFMILIVGAAFEEFWSTGIIKFEFNLESSFVILILLAALAGVMISLFNLRRER